jgi:adenylate kinase
MMEKAPISQNHLDRVRKWLGTGAINIFGLPFSGKDTHGRVLAELFGAPLLSSGEILRGDSIPQHVKDELDIGNLVPTDQFNQIILPYFSKEEFDGKPLILSSVGRWLGEEQGVIEASEQSGHPIKAVIYLQLSDHKVHERFHASAEVGDRGERTDDAEHLLDNRIQEFKDKTLPVIEEYRKLELLIEVNSEADKSEVLESILARLFVVASEAE